jgi:hypothetical protein
VIVVTNLAALSVCNDARKMQALAKEQGK